MSTSRPETLREAFTRHLMVTERKPRTVETYVEVLNQFHHFLNGKYPLRATANDIRAFLFHHVHKRGYAPRTYNQYFYGLKAFYEAFMPGDIAACRESL